MNGTWILPKQLHTSAYVRDTEALNLDCVESSEICERLLYVRSKPSQSRIWLRKWKRDNWTRHLFGRILRPSLGQHFTDAWTSSLVDTRASPSQPQESDLEATTRGTCGPTSQTAFDFSDHDAVSLKMSKDTSVWGCNALFLTWQEWVTERRGEYSARRNAVRHTSGSGCSSWPSPVASEVRQGFQDRSRGMKGSQESLTTVVIKHGPPVPASSSTDGSRREFAKLNPRWVETLMGLPVGWTMPSCVSPVTIERTSYASSETELFQQPQNERSEL
jgi:hypothetical protein